ncbi:MAG: sporulation protein YabP [Erysipelotrichaceae bacterium]|nr:sporulation protein YabP [Erysipelotrichaceae bacterium]
MMTDSPIKFETNPYHRLMMSDRKSLDLSGVKQIDSFDANEFLLETSQGWCIISGKELTLDKLDTDKGEVSIRGLIDSIQYLSNKQGKSTDGFFKRLFQ